MKTIIRIYKEARKYWIYIIIATIAMLLVTAVNLITPRLTQNMIAIIEKDFSQADLPGVISIALALLLLYALRSLIQFIHSYLSHHAAWNFVADIRAKIYNHLQKLSMRYYHDKQTGQLMSRVVNDTANFELLIAHVIPDLITSILLFGGVTVILFTTNPLLAALTCIPIPLILLSVPFFKKIRNQHRKAQEHIAELNASLQDNFSGIKEIQIFNRQEDAYRQVDEHAHRHASSLIKALYYSAILHPAVGFLTTLGNVIVVGVGGYLALQNRLQVSEIVGFLLYLSQFYGPVSIFARIAEDLQSGIAGGERIFEVLDTEPDIKDSKNAISIGRVKGSISFEDVYFSYEDQSPVLEGINLEIMENEMVALVGPSGVGKTTLAALIPRFYDPVRGSIKIDGIDIKNIKLRDLRANISMVLQDVFLFNGTIRDNIAYGKPDASLEEIQEAAKIACVHDFIMSLPDGYNTVVGERGLRLSGGQKQRISIARSVLRNAPILIMDEATSAVDTETEREIQEAIQKIAGSRTLIVIAHRLSTVRRADKIVVLENGRIVEQGRHEELLAKRGLYAHLCEVQTIKE